MGIAISMPASSVPLEQITLPYSHGRSPTGTATGHAGLALPDGDGAVQVDNNRNATVALSAAFLPTQIPVQRTIATT